MEAGTWTGLTWGLGLACLYGVASFLSARWAMRAEPRRSIAIALGTLAVRMALGLLAALLILLLADVPPGAFVGAFFAGFVVLLALEVGWLARR